MKYEPIKLMLEQQELPAGFAYPQSFMAFLQRLPPKDELEPWGITASLEADTMYSEQFHIPLVQFAQAWHEDMVACFFLRNENELGVLVLNPWAQTCEDGEWKETGEILEDLLNFEAWLDWVRNSELVKMYAEHRIEQRR